jgi:hypothetical protein
MNWIDLAQYWDKRRVLVNMLMNFIKFGGNS